ncbi:hypothetical protein CHS0354_011052 [Potamilus streckersoni]|uniref:Uncharacterized protein n=1 Tax=Potamilus streckersoni TaxID=2493646 RepID=A0AAE0TKZ0_9BIVA|nr:hypothetical protein CHS0354_011052 [Potamilus streckersoni]
MFRVIDAATILLSSFVYFICSADIKNGIGDSSETMTMPPMGYMKMEDLSSMTALSDIVDEMVKPQSVHVRASTYLMPSVMYPSLRPIVSTGLSTAMNGFAAYVGPLMPTPIIQPIPQTPLSFGLPAAKNNMPMTSVPIGFGNQVSDVARAFSFGNYKSGHTMDILSRLEGICSQTGTVIRLAQAAGLDSFLKHSQTLQDITQCLIRSCSLLHDVRNQMMSQIKSQVTSAFVDTLVDRASGDNSFGNTQNSTDGSYDSSD